MDETPVGERPSTTVCLDEYGKHPPAVATIHVAGQTDTRSFSMTAYADCGGGGGIGEGESVVTGEPLRATVDDEILIELLRGADHWRVYGNFLTSNGTVKLEAERVGVASWVVSSPGPSGPGFGVIIETSVEPTSYFFELLITDGGGPTG